MVNKHIASLHISQSLVSTSDLVSTTGLLSLDALGRECFDIPKEAFITPDGLPTQEQDALLTRIGHHDSPSEYYVSVMVDRIVTLAHSIYVPTLKICLSGADVPAYAEDVVVDERNPAIGLRGVSRFDNEQTRQSFLLDCEIIKRVREYVHLPVIEVLVPFVRTVSDAAKAIDLLAEQGLCRGTDNLQVHLLCEVPNNALQMDKLLPYFDGVLLDVDMLTQFTLALDLEHCALQGFLDKVDEGVCVLLKQASLSAVNAHKPCGVIISSKLDTPELRRRMVRWGANSLVVCE